MAPVNPLLINEFNFPCSAESVIEHVWLNETFYRNFFQHSLKDLDIKIDPWVSHVVDGESFLSRNVSSMHPAKIKFPGLASHTLV